MPHFFDQKRNLLISTNFKVMYTRLALERSLQQVELPFFKSALHQGADLSVLVRNPYSRLRSFFKDKFRQNLINRKREHAPWQHCQRLFFDALGLTEQSDNQTIEKRFGQTSYNDFVGFLPGRCVDDGHLKPQSGLLQEIDSVLAELAQSGRVCHYQLVHLELKSETVSFTHKSGINMGRVVNSTSSVWLDDDSLTNERLDIVHRLYGEDFERLGYTVKSLGDTDGLELPSTDALPPLDKTRSTKTGKNFITQARLLMRTVMNVGSAAIPARLDTLDVNRSTEYFSSRITAYRQLYMGPFRPFFNTYLPQNRPEEVIYLFGGGDLISALLAYEQPPLLTSISLEQAGDARCIDTINAAELLRSLASMKTQMGGTLAVGSNTSDNLSDSQRNLLPVQLLSFLIALEVHGFEPVALYYFSLNSQGSINYLDDARIDDLVHLTATRLYGDWCDPNFSCAFANVEIQYRAKNSPSNSAAENDSPILIYRHIAANLFNQSFGNSLLRKHLEAKGQVSGLVKGASYLLWQDCCAQLRQYMLAHMPVIVSDSTGIPVQYAQTAGYSIQTFGQFNGSFLRAASQHNDDMRALWRHNPLIKMPNRFGYVDSNGHPHLMLASRALAGES